MIVYVLFVQRWHNILLTHIFQVSTQIYDSLSFFIHSFIIYLLLLLLLFTGIHARLYHDHLSGTVVFDHHTGQMVSQIAWVEPHQISL